MNYDIGKTSIPNGVSIDRPLDIRPSEMEEWCKANLKGEFNVCIWTVELKDKDDILLYLLRYGGETNVY